MTVRDEAIMICAIAASHSDPYYWRIAMEIEASRASLNLAAAAWSVACFSSGKRWTREVPAEAEAMLQTGWAP